MRLPASLPPEFSRLTQQEVALGDTRIAYLEAGEGAPLLLVHGAVFAGNRFWWETQASLADELSGMRILCPDLPGWGASGKPTGDYSVEFYHQSLLAFLDALDIGRVALVGHSMGGLIATSFALLHPERIERLVTVCAPPPWVEFPLPRLFQPFLLPGIGELMLAFTTWFRPASHLGIRRFHGPLFADFDAIPQDRFWEAMDDGCRTLRDPLHRQAFLSTIRSNAARFSSDLARYRSAMADIRFPMLMVAGRSDPLFPPEHFEAALALYPEARLEILEDCAHFPMWERGDRFVSLLAGFLRDS